MSTNHLPKKKHGPRTSTAKGERVFLRSTVNRATGSAWVSTEVALTKAATHEAAVTAEIMWQPLP